jgi:hypothetical protein
VIDLSQEEMQKLLLQYDAEFDERCLNVAREQGVDLDADMQEVILNELVQLSLSARYTFMKIRLLQYKLSKEQEPQAPDLGFKKGM